MHGAFLLRGAALAATLASGGAARVTPSHIADAANPATLHEGAALYAAHCASCHGRRREGQPLWQLADSESRRRAPALDATGHGWRHSDEALFTLTGTGRPAMPGFAATLGDDEILAVLAFIKSRWPAGLRAAQSLLNGAVPDGPGWRFPATCRAGSR